MGGESNTGEGKTAGGHPELLALKHLFHGRFIDLQIYISIYICIYSHAHTHFF